MISRTGTVSVSNMNVLERKILGPGGAFPRSGFLTNAFFQSQVALRNDDSTDRESTSAKEEALSKAFVTEGHDDWEIVSFATSPKMSPHLVAFANGPFEHIESTYVSTLSSKVIPVRIYATHDHITMAWTALKTQIQALGLCEKMLGVEFPLPKV